MRLVPFESLGAVSYLHFIVTMAVYLAVREITSIKEWRDLENICYMRVKKDNTY